MKLSLIACSLLAMFAIAAVSAAEGDAKPHQEVAAAERVTVTGTVTELNAQKKSFTLKEDGSGKTESYRAFYAGGNAEEMAAKIAALKVGEHLEVVYTVREGRRALSLKEAK